jgi:hypothetical protein
LQREPAGAQVIRTGGGKFGGRLMATIGIFTTTFAIALSTIPAPDEPHKLLEGAKILGSTAVLIAVGAGIYWAGKRRAR